MPVDFFIPRCQTENIREKEFGIRDDEDEYEKTRAYIDLFNPEKWIAVVKNETGMPLNFTAIDNCIEILRNDGTMDNRCDATLTNEDNIVFIELKNQKEGWIAHAVDAQLQTTIDHFNANYDIKRYKHKRAFACNKKRPYFNVNYKEKMDHFYRKNHVRLSLESRIFFK